MRSGYKKLGPYIREVANFNNDLSVSLLLGVSVSKEFIPSIANIIGTDMSRYKIVRNRQFAYGPVTSRNSDKVSIALLHEKECIVSTSYTVFEITDHIKLLPEYLMMWFRRPEFDRYARFKSHGSVRELFGWEEMCDVELPIPPIEKQRKIAKEYQVIVDRIKLNQKLSQKLEETAQAIYKHWFVDFEFPMSAEYATSIGKPELEGQPYRSSGGDMVYNEVLEQEIPKGWKDATVLGISKAVVCGKTPPTSDMDNYGDYIPFITIPDMHNKIYVDQTERSLSKKGAATQKNKTLPPNAICVSCIASPGIVVLTSRKCQTNQQINTVICDSETSHYFAYFALLSLGHKIKEWGRKGSVGANMNKSEFSQMTLLRPETGLQNNFHKVVQPIFIKIFQLLKEKQVIINLQRMINSRMVLLQ